MKSVKKYWKYCVNTLINKSDDRRMVWLFMFFQSIQDSVDFRLLNYLLKNIKIENVKEKPLFSMSIDGKFVSGKNSQKPSKVLPMI